MHCNMGLSKLECNVLLYFVLKTWASAIDVECNDFRIRLLGPVNLSERF